MLRFLASAQPPRTKVAHLSSITFDDGHSSIRFLNAKASSQPNSSQQQQPEDATASSRPSSSSSSYLVVNRLPPAPPAPNSHGTNCALCPPVHFHRWQSETFHVLRGRARFFFDSASLDTATDQTVGPGDVVTVPAGRFHTFRNASDREELELEFGLNPPAAGNGDERFFRNTQTYRDDCRRHGLPRSFAQVLLFNYYGGVVLALPGPQVLARPLGVLLNFFGGLVLGKWLLGLRGSCQEYFHDDENDFGKEGGAGGLRESKSKWS